MGVYKLLAKSLETMLWSKSTCWNRGITSILPLCFRLGGRNTVNSRRKRLGDSFSRRALTGRPDVSLDLSGVAISSLGILHLNEEEDR